MKSAKAQGKPIGRPKKIFDREEVLLLRQQGLSFAQIARQMRLGHGTVVRILQAAGNGSRPVQNAATFVLSDVADVKGLAEAPESVL